eukprot:TRINITY_DN7890_c0_g2_i1.p1 TRINITY_DN7890_c0_g2~~TRINITY_DN7890_c0_g2_i1.p1  ORF type:complete len:350 (-),score=87.94 TRINITY_DN7890_c0_g2_i1:362-1411(-)
MVQVDQVKDEKSAFNARVIEIQRNSSSRFNQLKIFNAWKDYCYSVRLTKVDHLAKKRISKVETSLELKLNRMQSLWLESLKKRSRRRVLKHFWEKLMICREQGQMIKQCAIQRDTSLKRAMFMNWKESMKHLDRIKIKRVEALRRLLLQKQRSMVSIAFINIVRNSWKDARTWAAQSMARSTISQWRRETPALANVPSSSSISRNSTNNFHIREGSISSGHLSETPLASKHVRFSLNESPKYDDYGQNRRHTLQSVSPSKSSTFSFPDSTSQLPITPPSPMSPAQGPIRAHNTQSSQLNVEIPTTPMSARMNRTSLLSPSARLLKQSLLRERLGNQLRTSMMSSSSSRI